MYERISPRILFAVVSAVSIGLFTAQIHAQSTVAVAAEIGITPEALVVADLSTNDAQVILGRIEAATTERQALVNAHQSAGAAVSDVNDLREQFAQAPGDEQLGQQLAAAERALVSALAQVESAQLQLLSLALEGYSGTVTTALSTYNDGATYRTPAAFRIATRSEWYLIECALRTERRCARTGEDMRDDYVTLLAAIRSDPEVASAQARIESRLESMRQAFEHQ